MNKTHKFDIFAFFFTCNTEFKKQELPVLTSPDTSAEGSFGSTLEFKQMTAPFEEFANSLSMLMHIV